MTLFPKAIEINQDEVQAIVSSYWKNLVITSRIKASQNHTFQAEDSESKAKYAIRVTPDPSHTHQSKIEKEVAFVNYLARSKQLENICCPVPTTMDSEQYLIIEKNMCIIVLGWARGAPIDYFSYRWMFDEKIVKAWGAWFSQAHQLSRQFSREQPEIAQSIQRWDEIHSGVMKGSVIHPDDEIVVSDEQHFGVIHGDLNISNFFYIEDNHTLSVFDWDQTQRGWYLWDLAQALLGVYMLYEGGSLIDGSEIPGINPSVFTTWLIEGYESVSVPPGSQSIRVDRARLQRMLELRMSFYERFCRRATEEGDIPKDMEFFINYVVKWFDKKKSNSTDS